MSEKDNVQLVQQIYAAFGKGDIPGILNTLADNAEVHHSGPKDVLPWARVYRGHREWTQFFKDLGDTVEVQAFEPREYVAQGDKVVALGYYKFRAKATGRTLESSWVMDWTIRGNKVAVCRIHEDTAALVAAIQK